jgi:OOP family OmpA-OmpF porin
MKCKIFLLLIGMSVLFAANLDAQVNPGSFSVSPTIGYYLFNEDRNTLTYGAGIGYDFLDELGIEGTYRHISTEKFGSTEVDGYFANLDALLYFFPGEKFTPYIAFGVGHLDLDISGIKSTAINSVDYGVGMKYFVSNAMALRADLRHIMPSDGNDFLATAGLSFYFGGEKEAVEEEPAPEPVPLKDSDGDGVTDDMDQCPKTPAGVTVDSRGCSVDSDGDGVSDDKDQCPNTPTGIKVDSKGCPADSDGDGITDDKDQCPNTPEGAKVDSRGCWVIRDLRFDTGTADIKADGARILDNVVAVLQANPSVKVEIQGHTDNVGSAAFNKALSQKRAESVMDYMAKKGIGKERMSAKGYGFDRPAVSNDTAAGRAENRRVELKTIQ